MAGVVPVNPRFKFFLADGSPAALGWVTVYLAGTTTLASVWQNKALTTAQTNPKQLDANGEMLMWVDSANTYKILLQDVNLATVSGYPVDNIPGSADIGTAVTAAQDWATKTDAAVSGSLYSSKEYAQGTQASTGGSAKNWAQQTAADVTGASANSRSAKSWAQDNLAGATLGGSAKDWAQSASSPDGTLKSAKSYATDAQNYASGVGALFYDTIAAGLAATASGTSFGVIAGGADNLERPSIYRDTAGVATLLYSVVPGSEFDAKLVEGSTSANLYDAANPGYFLNPANGALSASGLYETSGFIAVDPSSDYALHVAGSWATYDSSQAFLAYGTTQSFTTGVSAAYARVSFAVADTYKIFTSGTYVPIVPTAYAAGISIPGLVLDETEVKEHTVYLDQLKTDITVQARNLGFLTRDSVNLFDKNQALLNTQLYKTGGVYTGSIVPSGASAWFTTDLIPVTGGATYRISETLGWVQYNSSLEVVAYESAMQTTITMDASAAYFRTVARTSVIDSFMMTLNASWPTAYKEYDRYVIPARITHTNPWRGKKIVWMGTSVPDGGGYPEAVGVALDANVVNIAYGGALITAFDLDGSMQIQSDMPYLFTLLAADVTSWAGANIGSEVNASDYSVLQPGSGVTLTQGMLDALVASNYIALLVPHYDADLFVFDFGYNDMGHMGTSAAAAGYDRRYFTGAMKYLWKQIYDYKTGIAENFQAVVVTHHNRAYPATQANALVNEQLDVASWLGVPCINLADNMGINDVNLLRYTDTVHFSAGSDLYYRYVTYITERLKEVNP
jgi:hypothetical protein